MNRRNNWQKALGIANANLKSYGIALDVTWEDNTFSLNVIYSDSVEPYASGYFEDELEDLIQYTCFRVIGEEQERLGELNYE